MDFPCTPAREIAGSRFDLRKIMKSESQVNPKHVIGIDILRFMAAIIVMWYHYGFWLGLDPNKVTRNVSQGFSGFPEIYDYSHFGWIGVQVFFVISGFVIAFSAQRASYFEFFVSRVIRLAPCVWICASITLFFLFSVDGGFQLILRYLRAIFFIPFGPMIDASYWTLGMEMGFYSMIFMLLFFDKFSWIRNFAVVIGCISAAFWFATYLSAFWNIEQLSAILKKMGGKRMFALVLVHHGIFFSIGILLWNQIKHGGYKNAKWFAILAAAGCLQIVATSRSLNADSEKDYTAYLTCGIWLFSIVFIYLSVRLNHHFHTLPQSVLRATRTAGLMTFPIYLLHQMAGSIAMGWLIRFGMGRWTALAITMVAVIVVSWLVAMKLEPPLQRVTKESLYRMRNAYRRLFNIA